MQPYGREVAAATLASKRTHGQRLPEPPDKLSAYDGMRARHAVNAASDRVHTAHLQPGMRVRVRCYSDGLERDGHVTAESSSRRAPRSTVEVDSPDGYRDLHGHMPIDPCLLAEAGGAAIRRCASPSGDVVHLAAGAIIRAATADEESITMDGNYLSLRRS